MSDVARRVLVTGANKGIGFATVEAILASKEDTVVLLGSRDAERGEAACAKLKEAHPEWKERVIPLQIDVGDDASVKKAVARVSEIFQGEKTPLYGIVNNAGIGLGESSLKRVLDVNTLGPRRVCEAFLPLIRPAGRIVNISSAAGPNFIATCSSERQQQLTSPDVTWETVQSVIDEALKIADGHGSFADAGLGDGSSYGLSKACLNAYTIDLARRHPEVIINACTPGFIETDLTRPYAEQQNKKPSELGMKAPSEGTKAQLFLLFGEPGGRGWYFGSDAQRSPLDRYRSPGDPPYDPDR